jgi:hypothetical protein
MIKDRTELRKDGQRTLQGGMNSGRSPVLLGPEECSYATNVTFRGGYPTNRPKFIQVQVADAAGFPGHAAAFATQIFQGAAVYDLDDGNEVIMSMTSGILTQLNIAGPGLTVQEVYNDGKNNPTAPQCWFCQAEEYFVIQDGSATPLIMQGLSTIRRAQTTEVPVGTAMAYGQGRLWLAQGRQVVAGDLLGGPTSVISFTEQTYLGEAAYFGVPLNSGNVVGLIFIEQGDTNTGQGDLLLFARNAVYSIQASVPREATTTQPGWQGTPGMQKIAITNIGGTGWRNLTNVNSDVFFRARDGWRTYRTARNQMYGWGTAHISNEMQRVMGEDSLYLLDYASSALYKNRVYLTSQPLPYRSDGASSFGGLVVLDLDIISSVINKSNLASESANSIITGVQRGSPAYDGFWQLPGGRRILQILSGTFEYVERIFIFCLNPSTNQTEIWEMTDEQAFDIQNTPVTCQVETRAMDFKLPDSFKELRRGDLYFTSMMASIKVTVEYRSDGYPAWTLWQTLTLQSQQAPCTMNLAICQNPGCPVEGYWFCRSLTTPNPDCDVNTSKLLRNGYFFQFRITWVGPATLLMFIAHCTELVEPPNNYCPPLNS